MSTKFCPEWQSFFTLLIEILPLPPVSLGLLCQLPILQTEEGTEREGSCPCSSVGSLAEMGFHLSSRVRFQHLTLLLPTCSCLGLWYLWAGMSFCSSLGSQGQVLRTWQSQGFQTPVLGCHPTKGPGTCQVCCHSASTPKRRQSLQLGGWDGKTDSRGNGRFLRKKRELHWLLPREFGSEVSGIKPPLLASWSSSNLQNCS